MHLSTIEKYGTMIPLPNQLKIQIYSIGHEYLINSIKNTDFITYSPPSSLKRTLWGLEFKSPIMTSAGLDKNGELILCQKF